MKRLFTVLTAAAMLFGVSGCGGKITRPETEQIRTICELATLECYYHNVARAVKTKGEGLAHLFEKDRKFWIEFQGVARIGVNMEKVNVTVKNQTVTVTLPEAEVLSIRIDEKSYRYTISEDGFLNHNKITAEDQKLAVKDAEEAMRESVKANTALYQTARERAKTLIQQYIDSVGDAVGVTYTIEWKLQNDNVESGKSETQSD